MVRGEKASGKRNQRKRVKLAENGSDYDTDEDYVISEQESDASEDVLEDLDVSALEGGLDNLDEDEQVKDQEYEVEDDDENGYENDNCPRKSISRPRSSRGRKANRNSLQNGTVSKEHVLDKFEVEDEEDEKEENKDKEDPRKPCTRPRSSRGRKANKNPLEKNVTVSRKYDSDNLDEVKVELEDEEEELEEFHKKEGADSRKSHARSRSPCRQKTDEKNLCKNRLVSEKEEEDDDDEEYVMNDEDEEDDDDDDDEFTPEEKEDDYNCLDDEEDSNEEKGTGCEFGTRKRTFKRKASQWNGRRKKGSKVSRKTPKKRETKQIRLPKKVKLENGVTEENGDEFLNEYVQWRRTGRKDTGRRKRKFVASSDSDFMTSASSDCEFTISEEEREQVKEANEFCETQVPCMRKLSTSKRLVGRGSSSLRTSQSRAGEGDNTANQKKSTGTKGKEKVEEPNVMKQVCGICLSEEDKRKVRGTLDCCSHYFCFTCIKEWSKVESRCPLCKQRFHTITKLARCNAGNDLRDVVLQVPERDQVYQPTEEEIRGYLDPYENVICTECHQGGDDDLMLLCDLCDSPAHTFCVGLGREVPEGSWYCDGCRPGALESLGSQSHDHLPNNQRTSSNFPSWTIPTAGFTEGFDLNAPPSIQVLNFPSPRFPLGISQSLSPLSGAQASTLSGRRMIHRHIQLRNGMSPRTDGSSTSIFLIDPQPFPVDRSRLVTLRSTGMETMAVNFSSSVGLTQEIPFPALLRREVPVLTAPSTSGRRLLNGCVGMNMLTVPEQIHVSSSRLSVNSDSAGVPPLMREQSYPYRPEEQLQTMIKVHLRSLPVGNSLGYDDVKDIEKSSIDTILAACGIGQQSGEASAIPPALICSHINDGAGNRLMSLMKGSCSACFDVFVKEVVQNNLKAKLQQQWLSLGL